MIALQNVSIRAGAFELADVSFSVASGAYAVLMGRTGAGKVVIAGVDGYRIRDSGEDRGVSPGDLLDTLSQ